MGFSFDRSRPRHQKICSSMHHTKQNLLPASSCTTIEPFFIVWVYGSSSSWPLQPHPPPLPRHSFSFLGYMVWTWRCHQGRGCGLRPIATSTGQPHLVSFPHYKSKVRAYQVNITSFIMQLRKVKAYQNESVQNNWKKKSWKNFLFNIVLNFVPLFDTNKLFLPYLLASSLNFI